MKGDIKKIYPYKREKNKNKWKTNLQINKHIKKENTNSIRNEIK